MAATATGSSKKAAPPPEPDEEVPARPPVRPSRWEPVRLSTTAPERPEVVYDEPVFYVDDTPWCMPSDPPMIWGTDYLNGVAAGGQEAAGASVQMYKRMLTEAGWEALCTYRQLTRAQFKQVLMIVQENLMGELELPKDASDG